MIVEPRDRYDLGKWVKLRIPRGLQWWNQGTPLQCKVVNVASTGFRLQRERAVATVYAVNNFDGEKKMKLTGPVPVQSNER